jgi:hypothetical protein
MYELWKGVLFRAGFFAWWPGALRILRSVLRDIENMTPWTWICHLSLEIGSFRGHGKGEGFLNRKRGKNGSQENNKEGG